jgi:hypothetical protein
MGNIFGKKVLPAKSESSFNSTTVQPPSSTSTYNAVASENRSTKDGRKKRSKRT